MTDHPRAGSERETGARNELEHLLLDFDQTWTPHRLESVVASLPPASSSFHQITLRELIAIDMERYWQQGQRPAAEDYLSRFPECDSTTAAALRATEDEIRQQFGDAISPQAEAASGPSHTVETWPACLLSTPGPSAPAEHANPGDQTTDPQPQDSGTLPLPAADMLSGTFGRYRIEKLLGQGGMGAVYLATDTLLGRKVALKTPRSGGAHADELIQRLYNEARCAAQLRHPGICPVHDAGQFDGRHYLSMDWIEGRSLKEFISRENPLPEQSAAAIIAGIAEALQHAHARGVIHRDLKPENVMLNREQQPVIMDFGLARRFNQPAGTRITQTGVSPGTPAYMSPEQTRGRRDEIGPPTDIFSLGVIFYELLTGELPFPGSTTNEVFAQINTQEPLLLDQLRPDIDPQLQAVCERMLSKQLDRRYSSMHEVAADLSAWRQQTGTAPHASRFPPRLRWLTAGVLAATVLAAIAARPAHQPATARGAASEPVVDTGFGSVSAEPGDQPAPVTSRAPLFISGGHWTVVGDELVQSKVGECILLFGDLDWTDYDVSVETMTRPVTQNMNGGKLIFRARSLADNYVFAPGGYGGTWDEAYYFIDSVWHRDGTALSTKHEPYRWYHMRVRVRGPQTTCWLDDKLLFEFQNNNFASGCIGLATWDCAVAWRNLKVTAPDGRVLWEGWPELPEPQPSDPVNPSEPDKTREQPASPRSPGDS